MTPAAIRKESGGLATMALATKSLEVAFVERVATCGDLLDMIDFRRSTNATNLTQLVFP
jgi:hypothetical protein